VPAESGPGLFLMKNEVRDVFSQAVEDLADAVVEVTFGGTTASGFTSEVTLSDSHQLQGLEESYERTIYVSGADFPSLIDYSAKALTQITIGGEQKTLLSYHPDELGALVRLDIGERYAAT